MTFLRLEYLGWWQVLPVLVACWAIRYHYLARMRRASRVAPRFAGLSRRATWKRELAVLLLTIVVAGALVFALVRPQAMLTTRTPEYEQQDLVLMLDRSASMRAHDITPSRFSRATLEIQNFLKNKPEGIDRVGLVGFANSSLILSYLTRDLDTVSFYLDWIEHDPQTLLGTDIGAAMKNAREVARKDDRPTRKLFLLVSDGEDYGGELARQMAQYRSDGYRVHCIGIGTEDYVPIPVMNPDGKEVYLRDDSGQVVRTKFEEATLRQIATGTGGRYLRSTTGSELSHALDEVVKGERTIRGWKTTTEYRDLYPAALALAAIAGALLWLLL
ncbi:MAG TPA: VWA domain-containing protein [Vicinamibacterales bacterium]